MQAGSLCDGGKSFFSREGFSFLPAAPRPAQHGCPGKPAGRLLPARSPDSPGALLPLRAWQVPPHHSELPGPPSGSPKAEGVGRGGRTGQELWQGPASVPGAAWETFCPVLPGVRA